MAEEAAEYVDSIMSSQRVTRVGTPATGRKRNRSAPSPILSGNRKKARNSQSNPGTPKSEDESSPSRGSSSRRALYTDAPTPAPRRKIYRNSDGGNGSEAAMEKLIDRLSVDISNRFSELNDRIDRLEKGLEQRISTKVAQLLDKRINTEMKKLRKDVDAHVESVTESMKAEVAADIADMSKKLENVKLSTDTDISRNIVIRNLQETENENVKEKVSMVMKEGCGIRDIEISSAERKKGPQGKPGVVVVKFHTQSDKKVVMQNKRKLKNSRRFQNVYIQHDQTRTDRLIADNFRTVLTAIKRGDHNISMNGARVVRGDNRSHQQVSNTTQRPDSDTRRNGGRRDHYTGNSSRDNQHRRRY